MAIQNSATRRFCCFHWENLECELKIARKCDKYWADKLDQDTMMNGICAKYPRKDFQKHCVGVDLAQLDKEDQFFRRKINRRRDVSRQYGEEPALSPSSSSPAAAAASSKTSKVTETVIVGMSAVGSAIVGISSLMFMETGTVRKAVVTAGFALCSFFAAWLFKLTLYDKETARIL